MLLESAGDEGPGLSKIDFAVLGEQDLESGFFGKGASFVVFRFERFFLQWVRHSGLSGLKEASETNLPFVDVRRIPRLISIVVRWHDGTAECVVVECGSCRQKGDFWWPETFWNFML